MGNLTARLQALDAEADRFRAAIQRAFPALVVERIERLGAGWDSDVFEVNNALVFRFPKRPDVVPWLEREILVLPELAPLLPLPIPRFQYVARGCPEWPLPFVGYPKLSGRPLPEPPQLPRGWAEIGRALGAFTSALHRFPAERAAELGVPLHRPPAWRRAHETLWRQIQAWVYPLLTPLERRMVNVFFERFLGLLAQTDFTPVLVHSDLNEDHVLMDETESQVAGVIDFGDMRVADAALDFARFPLPFVEAMLSTYRGPLDPSFVERARYYGCLESFRGVLFGLDTGDRALVKASLAQVRRQVRDL